MPNMGTSEVLLLLILLAAFVLLALCALLLVRRGRDAEALDAHMELLRQDLAEDARASRMELTQTVAAMIRGSDERLTSFAMQNEQKLEGIRQTIQNRLREMQEDNASKLEKMRATVDEKLQKTLESRISESFQLVSERLEQVYKGLGEMRTLARGVGDLQKVLSNVKNRGIMGEIRLGAILEDILPTEQYVQNFMVRPGCREAVEYAIRMPGVDETPVYLPVDAKFPADAYARLQDAYDAGDTQGIEMAAAGLRRALLQAAKDIHIKYIQPPYTTDFAILFLPFEGLYAEVVRRGMLETAQHEYKVVVAGPSTMAALLNSLQMGFKTLAIQKRSGEVWSILGAVKTEFDKFESSLKSTQQRLDQANAELEKLVGARTRQIRRKLQSVTELPEAESARLLDVMDNAEWEESTIE